jgi:hypothetical protein
MHDESLLVPFLSLCMPGMRCVLLLLEDAHGNMVEQCIAFCYFAILPHDSVASGCCNNCGTAAAPDVGRFLLPLCHCSVMIPLLEAAQL